MNKKLTFVITVALFICQSFSLAGNAPAEVYLLNPPTEVGTAGNNTSLKDACSVFFTAFEIYQSDVFKRVPKETLIEKYRDVLKDSMVRFDLENIDIGRKGWTRYYPFSVGERNFVVRIFLTKELLFQPKVPIMSELVVQERGVTLQILPDINEILNDCRIKPNKICRPSITDRSA